MSYTVNTNHAAFQDIPDYMVDGVIRYIEKGILPGTFMQLIIQNDFVGAAAHADDRNKECLYGWALVLMHVFPGRSWGSVQAMRDWMAERREQIAANKLSLVGEKQVDSQNV